MPTRWGPMGCSLALSDSLVRPLEFSSTFSLLSEAKGSVPRRQLLEDTDVDLCNKRGAGGAQESGLLGNLLWVLQLQGERKEA